MINYANEYIVCTILTNGRPEEAIQKEENCKLNNERHASNYIQTK